MKILYRNTNKLQYYLLIIVSTIVMVLLNARKDSKIETENESRQKSYKCLEYSCVIKDIIALNNTEIHILADNKSSKLRQLTYPLKTGNGFLHFHYVTPSFKDKIVLAHNVTFFSGYLNDEFSAIKSAAILWDQKKKFGISKLGINQGSFTGSAPVREFATLLFNSLVEFKIKTQSEYVQYDHAIIQARKVDKDISNYLMLIRRFKAYFYSTRTKRTKIVKPGTRLVCTYFSDPEYLMQLTEHFDDLIKISPQWGPAKKAYLLQLCDILIVQNSIDVSLIFLLKPTVVLLALNSDLEWIKNAESLWNIKIMAQQFKPLSSGSVKSIVSLIKILRYKTNSRYFFFMPWEQLNNQIIGFKAACAMAKTLNRVLVLPYLGYRKSNDWDFTFDVKNYTWSPMENYFEFSDLPCEIISLSNFKSVNGINIGDVYYNPVAKATSFVQIQDYYKGVLGLNVVSIKNQSRLYQLNQTTVLKLFGSYQSKVLSFGALFWAYGFGKEQEYPLKEYISYMDNPLYRQITLGIHTKRRIRQYAERSISKRIGSKSIITAHLRRGDYWKKCKSIMDPVLKAHCFPSVDNMKSKIEKVLKGGIPNAILHSAWDEESYYVYISTNLDADRSELNELLESYPVLFFEDIFKRKQLKIKRLNPIHIALLDKEIGIQSHEFIGNFYSSFSRTIFEGREIANKTSFSF